MKEMNSPENQLRSWQPRQPSARLKRAILTDNPARVKIAWAFRFVAPAAACLLLALTVFHQTGPARHYEPIMALGTSNQYAPYLAVDREHDRNDFSRLTFEWTNHSGSTSSISSFLPGSVN